MKKLIILFSIIFAIFSANIVQALPTFWYSGFAFNSEGIIVPNSSLDVKVTLNDGTSVYEEVHYSVYTNEFGAFAVNVGDGDVLTGILDDIQIKAGTNIEVAVNNGSGYVIVEGSALTSVYMRTFAGSIGGKKGTGSLQSAYYGGNTINISAVDETTQVERPVIIRNPNLHPNLVLENQNGSEGQTWANALSITRGSTVLSTYHADGDNTTYDLSYFGFASIIFVDQDILYLPPGTNGQVLYIVNTLPRNGQYGQNVISVYYDQQNEYSLPLLGGTTMHLVSDGSKWYPVFSFPFLY